MGLARLQHDLVGLRDHFEGVVVANCDALGAALALGRVDDDLEHAADAVLLLAGILILLGLGRVGLLPRTVRFGNDLELLFQFGFGQDLAEDGGVGALGDAVHAAGAVFG